MKKRSIVQQFNGTIPTAQTFVAGDVLTLVDDTWWWLSFADGKRPVGQQFLGVVLVRAPEFTLAVMATHRLGVNPGGEVCGTEFTGDGLEDVLQRYAGRLLSKDECAEFDRAIGGTGELVRPPGLEED